MFVLSGSTALDPSQGRLKRCRRWVLHLTSKNLQPASRGCPDRHVCGIGLSLNALRLHPLFLDYGTLRKHKFVCLKSDLQVIKFKIFSSQVFPEGENPVNRHPPNQQNKLTNYRFAPCSPFPLLNRRLSLRKTILVFQVRVKAG